MATWKVLLIGLMAAASMALATASVLVPMSASGSDRWAWLGGLVPATLVVGGLLVLFLRYASRGMDEKVGGRLR